MVDVKLLPQEESVHASFRGRAVSTSGFDAAFGLFSLQVMLVTLTKVFKERVNTAEGADYLQICECKGIRYWCMDDQNGIITFLLPKEY